MEPGQQQEIKMGGDHDQNGTSSANTNPLSSVSQGGEGGSDSLKGNEERLTNRAALRKGKWTLEEEEYTSRIIHYFNTGLLTLPEGATLRSYLADKLNCDPMRVTKKYAGASCLGRRVYHFHNRPQPTVAQIQLAKAELDLLEQRFRQRVEEGRSGGSNPSTSLFISPFNYAAAQAQPTNALAGPAAALQALLMNLAAATAAGSSPPPPAPIPQVNINASSGLLGLTQHSLQQPSVQPNPLASSAILEALGLQAQQQQSLESAVMSLAVARAAASLANPVPSPAQQQLNVLNHLLAQNQLVRSGAVTSQAPATTPPVQPVASSTTPAQPAPAPVPVKSDPAPGQLHVTSLPSVTQMTSVPSSVATPSAPSTVSAQSYTEQLKRNFEAHLRANNIPIPHPPLSDQNQSLQVNIGPVQPGLNQVLPSPPPPPPLPPPDAVKSHHPPPRQGDNSKASTAKKPPLSMKSAKSSPKKPASKKEKLSLEGKLSVKHHHSKALAGAAPRSKFSSQVTKQVFAKSAPKGAKPRTEEDKAAGTILVTFLSSLRSSYEDALRARGETTRLEESDDTDGARTVGSKIPNVTDCSSMQQQESSVDDSDWNSDKKTDPSSSEDSDKEEKEGRRQSSATHDPHKGPPRKRLKRIAMENTATEDEPGASIHSG